MRNVAGIGQSEALKALDMFMKCRYLDEVIMVSIRLLPQEHR